MVTGIRVDHPFFEGRLSAMSVFAFFVLGFLGVRLWYLQGINGAHFRDLSENNRTRTIRTSAPRGSIYDSQGRVLVKNRPAFDIALMLEDTPDPDKTLHELADVTGRSEEELQKQLSSQRIRRPFEPKVVMPDVSWAELARVKVNSYRLPGVIVDAVPTRGYPYNTLTAQVLGYAREITKEQLESDWGKDYLLGDVVGQAGIEKQWESLLRGRSGFIQVEVDAMGNRKGELGIADYTPGNDLYLTVDLDLQKAAEEAIAGKRAATVVLDPRTGAVLAMASAPSFDANLFSGELSAQDWQRFVKDKAHPMTNRVISDVYPCGSTFKLIVALAGLADKKITPATTFNCPGYYTFAGRRYHCHKASGHGTINLKTALTVSCNSYFYQLGQELGIEAIHKYATLLGLGGLTGIKLPNEMAGVIPSEQWKLKNYGERWYPGETLSVSIGQGYVAVTPMQLAVAIATIANGGTVYQPWLVKKIVNSANRETTEFQPTVLRKLDVAPAVFATVRDLAVAVVNDPHGTGTRAMLPGIVVGGKTGTAQVSGLGRGTGEQFLDHAWFLSFAPADNPTIATATIVENGGHGGVAAAPVSHHIMEVYFRKLGMLPPEEETTEGKAQKAATDSGSPASGSVKKPAKPAAKKPIKPAEPAPTSESSGSDADVPSTDNLPPQLTD